MHKVAALNPTPPPPAAVKGQDYFNSQVQLNYLGDKVLHKTVSLLTAGLHVLTAWCCEREHIGSFVQNSTKTQAYISANCEACLWQIRPCIECVPEVARQEVHKQPELSQVFLCFLCGASWSLSLCCSIPGGLGKAGWCRG